METQQPENNPQVSDALFEQFLPSDHPDATQMVIQAIADRVKGKGEPAPKVRVDISSTSYKLVPKTDI